MLILEQLQWLALVAAVLAVLYEWSQAGEIRRGQEQRRREREEWERRNAEWEASLWYLLPHPNPIPRVENPSVDPYAIDPRGGRDNE
jgi:hypothetical protein